MLAKVSTKITPKRKLMRTAAYAKKSVTDFVLSQTVEVVEGLLKAHKPHVLSTANWEAFCKALDRPAKPNRALKEGFRWYRNKVAYASECR